MDFLLVLRGIGIAMLLGGVALFRIHRQRRKEWTSTTGSVIEMVRGSYSSQRPSRAVRPVVEFTSAARQRIRFEGTVASWPPRYKVGDRAKVLYDPKNPQKAIVDDRDSSWIAPAIFFVFGLIVVLVTFAQTR